MKQICESLSVAGPETVVRGWVSPFSSLQCSAGVSFSPVPHNLELIPLVLTQGSEDRGEGYLSAAWCLRAEMKGVEVLGYVGNKGYGRHRLEECRGRRGGVSMEGRGLYR